MLLHGVRHPHLVPSSRATLRCPLSDERGNGKGERDSPAGGQGGLSTISPEATPIKAIFAGLVPPQTNGDRAEQKLSVRKRSDQPPGDGSAVVMTGKDAGRDNCPLPTCTSDREGGEAGPEGTEPRESQRRRFAAGCLK